MYEISCPEPNSEEAILTQCSFKVCTLHKHFLTQFGGHGNKQTSYIMNKGTTSHISKSV